jgi:hypothetical protein
VCVFRGLFSKLTNKYFKKNLKLCVREEEEEVVVKNINLNIYIHTYIHMYIGLCCAVLCCVVLC